MENWEMMYRDSGNAYYNDHHLKPSSWPNRPAHSRENVCMTELAEFTDQPSELKGFYVHTHLVKGSRGFGFNIVGGSRRREFLQIYSIIPGGPSTLHIGCCCSLSLSCDCVILLNECLDLPLFLMACME
ncbi:membrane-associated guanylate kinase, WW and PDZ domain-containing protein 3-like [Sinocyclocheilus grahami]|uniref:membrane-associated guanylate kinase, WW and PDZ domain-containing protein 3-like n=1 Tax=Sinocyclocheilus grahami TaxID=75366 RepID=UPI0007AD1097|nr:PREDICTED: membrane-associated guanylate kinase, WW and PDZ domain-containing protein 3-like [Sinocyclocheilus grahami]